MLKGKTALVTGSSSGIGLAVAKAFLANGAAVVLTSERPPYDEIAAIGPYIQADLTREGEAVRLVNEAWTRLGRIDILVNNVGTFREPGFLELTKKHFDFVFNVNVWSAISVTQALIRRATQEPGSKSGSQNHRGGRILFSTSLNGTRSEPAHTLYDASKGAVNGLVRQLAIELAPLGFTTAAVAPGLVETPLTDFGLRSDPEARRQIEQQIPIGRIATVEEVAGWYVFLASDAANYGTGLIVNVDGGLDAQQMPTRPVIAAERH